MFDKNKSLLRRVAKLERLMYERTVGRGGGDSNAYIIWKLLRDEGPSTSADIKNTFPSSQRDSIASMITNMIKADCIRRQGNNLVANLDYNWDDVGVIPRTAQQEMIRSIRNGVPRAADIQREPSTRSARAPRHRVVKQNLFSRKFDEVKAAVDAGQDVNQVNDKGQTPLLFAANSKTGNNANIIEYLLTHGADLTPMFKGLNAFALVCKNSNIDAMRVILANDTQNVITLPSRAIERNYKHVPDDKEIILLAASKEKRYFDREVHRFYYQAFASKTISQEQYEQAINTILYNCMYAGCALDVIAREVAGKITNTIEKIADKEKKLVDLYFAVFNNDVSDSIARKLLDLCGEVANGNLSIDGRVLDFIRVCKMLCNKVGDKSFMSNLLNPKFISNLDQRDLASLFIEGVRHDISILQKLVAAKAKLHVGTVCGTIVQEANKEITKLAVKLVDKSTTLDRWSISDIARCKNEYLINYVISIGYGENLLAWCADHASMLNDGMAVVKALKDNGFELPDDVDSRVNIISAANNNRDIKGIISNIIAAIKHDEWNRRLEEFVTDHPEILLNDYIAKAIEDNNNTTSRQLRRRIERLPKNQDVYDF
jgi:ankyrin repeat protein